ncbi:DUF6884 domain-containing protein [Methanocalculus sp. MSAO_Arc2]|uniref:DUF6884 domain-containing protein n=1 Tax=Methanocalculus sp. MSAO_Arc2 TaxID=2293855 RepID=UPI0032163FE2
MPARKVYTGSFVRTNQRYAERFYPESWCIISAKYGLLMPDDIVPENYNVRLTDPDAISTEELSKQAKRLGLDTYERVVILAGKAYVEALRKALPDSVKVEAPLADAGGMFGMMKRVRESIESGNVIC